MEDIKKEDLIIGETYKVVESHYWMIGLIILPNNGDNNGITERGRATLIDEKNKFLKDTTWCYQGEDRTYKLATSEEKHWLTTCIEADTFVTFEESIKTFIPEYVECTNPNGWRRTIRNNNNNLIFDTKNESVHLGGNNWKNIVRIISMPFKASTKEAYDAQFIVKEPEFVLPEKWCIKNTNTVIGDYFNKMTHVNGYDLYNKSQHQNEYLHSENWQGHKLINHDGSVIFRSFSNHRIRGNFTEITFEQFKQYVLKKEDIVQEINEPLPEFKVIETIETITKVENNEGSQFFIGDIVTTDGSDITETIKSFEYQLNKTVLVAVFTNNSFIDINSIEHYIDKFVLPEKWCVKIEINSKLKICQWFAINRQNSYTGTYDDLVFYGEYLHYPLASCSSHRGFTLGKIYDGYTAITFDQFKKHVLKETVN